MVDREDVIPLSWQAEVIGVSRSSLYYKPAPPSAMDLLVKMVIDHIYTRHPIYGSRRISRTLRDDYGLDVGRRAAATHMAEMGLEAIYPKRNISKADKEAKKFPYRLKGLDISRPNQVWSTDITYIPIRTSFLYLTAVIDWYSRYIVSWELDDTLDIGFVLRVCENARAVATPEIMNSDQGSHYTSEKYYEPFIRCGSLMSMDHRGRAYDNIRIERFWRSLKYEDVYLSDYQSPREALAGIRKYINFYNEERAHQSLEYRTPEDVYFRT
jgi:putative transposase